MQGYRTGLLFFQHPVQLFYFSYPYLLFLFIVHIFQYLKFQGFHRKLHKKCRRLAIGDTKCGLPISLKFYYLNKSK